MVEGPTRQLVYIDAETTGLSPAEHEIWELALILGDQERHWFLDVDLDRADPNALRISRFYERHPAVTEPESYEPHRLRGVAHQVAKLIANTRPVGINVARFDVAFLETFMRAHGQVPTWHKPIDVTERIAGRYLITDPLDTDSEELSRRIGVEPPTGGERHTALGDARWAKRMYERWVTLGQDELVASGSA